MKKIKKRIIRWLGIDKYINEKVAETASAFILEREKLRNREEFIKRTSKRKIG